MTDAPETPRDRAAFAGTIVALGASAGGLDALDRFFTSLNPIDGAAFVVIQHLAPEHKTMMDTLLARHTKMQVMVASEGVPLQGGQVYVIPPGTTMTVLQGRLRLVPRPTTGVTLPIDAFFESLALEAASRAIGIILSGTGSDGTRGAQALDEAGAWVLAQDPESAKFDGMPRAVIASGAVDHVLGPEALAAEVMSIIASGETRPARQPGSHHLREDISLEPVLRLLGGVMRVDFSQYKPTTLLRRVERRLTANGFTSLQGYADFIAAHPDEVDTLRRELLIPVTRFFRDPEAFTVLCEQALLPMVQERASHPADPIRVWVAATATGEEAYTIAMMLLDLIIEHSPATPLKMFATDVEPAYLERAAAGRYADADLADVPPAYRQRWFTALEGGHSQVRPDLRQRIVFSRHDLLVDAPFTQLDLVTCRNMLIYLRPAAQDRAIRRLSYALKPGGTLFLGSSESPTASAGDYVAIDPRQKIYRLQRRAAALPPDDLLPGRGSASRSPGGRGVGRADQALLRSPVTRALDALAQRYAPPAMLVTPERELLHVFGDLRRLLRFKAGDASLDVLQLLPPLLMPVVATLLHSAVRERAPQRSRALSLCLDDGEGESVTYHVSVWPLEPEAARIEQLLVCFEPPAGERPGEPPVLQDTALSTKSSEQIADLERELMSTRANLQDTIQELGTANEELQATNEELMASNEELQSTNEELQSVNEELHTVNAEFQIKINELNDLNADLESLTRATRIPLVFLDADMRLTRFTPEAALIFRFRDSDVGRPITDFSHTLDYSDLYEDIRATLDSPGLHQREVQDSSRRSWLVTVLPFANQERQRTRIVVSCVDVSSLRDVQRLQGVLDAMPAHVAVLDRVGVVQLVNRSWREFAERNGDHGLRASGPGVNYLDACRAAAATDAHARRVLQGLGAVLDGSRPAFMIEYPCHSPEEQRWFLMHVAPLVGGGCVVTHFNLTGWIDPQRLRVPQDAVH
jgi:two-component system CheB/CheR fusion protein